MVGIVEEGLENGTGGVTVGTCDGELGVEKTCWGSSKRVCCVMSRTKGILFESSKIRKGGAYVVSHAIFVPVGGGGVIAGIAAYVKRVSPQVKIIGVEPTDANTMALSLHHGQRVILDQVGGFADGVAVKEVGEETFRLCKELVDGVVLLSRDSICASIKEF